MFYCHRTIDAKGGNIKIGESKQGLNILHLVSDQNYIFGLQNVIHYIVI